MDKFSVILFVVGVMLIIYGFKHIQHATSYKTWPQVRFDVIDSGTVKIPCGKQGFVKNKSRQCFLPKLTYSYMFNGIKHTHERLYFDQGGVSFSSEQAAMAQLKDLKHVYVNPDNTAEAFIIANINLVNTYAYAVVGGALMILALVSGLKLF